MGRRLPTRVRWNVEINLEPFKVIKKVGNQQDWYKLVPLMGDTPTEGIHVVVQSGQYWPDSHLEYYNNSHQVGGWYPKSAIGGSVIATPSGAYTDLSSGYEVRVVPKEPQVTKINYLTSGESVSISSEVSGWVVFTKFPLSEAESQRGQAVSGSSPKS